MFIESIIYSDGCRSYNCAADIGYDKYFQADCSKNKFAGGRHHVRDRFRELNKTNFNPYLKGCVFGFNNRNRGLYKILSKAL